MALPKLKNATYELTLPSTGLPMHYRPFLVKEQKLLMLAQESEDTKQLESAFAQILRDCVEEITDPYKMTMFDVEYVFLKIRSKSVGEVIKLKLLCRDDNETYVDVEFNLDDVDVQMTENHTNIINLTDEIKLIMKYPCLGDMQGFDDVGEIKSLFHMIKSCVNEIHDGEEIHHRIDMQDNELEDFLDSMSTENFEKVSEFFETMPKLKHVIEVENPNTKVKNEIVVEGLESFLE
jgi:hypothetical protein